MAAVKMRQCIGCGEFHNGREMLRIVKSPEGEIRFDETGRAGGRGAYLCKNETCIQEALKRKGIERSLHVSLSKQAETDLGNRLSEEVKKQ